MPFTGSALEENTLSNGPSRSSGPSRRDFVKTRQQRHWRIPVEAESPEVRLLYPMQARPSEKAMPKASEESSRVRLDFRGFTPGGICSYSCPLEVLARRYRPGWRGNLQDWQIFIVWISAMHLNMRSVHVGARREADPYSVVLKRRCCLPTLASGRAGLGERSWLPRLRKKFFRFLFRIANRV